MMNDEGLLECPFCGSNDAYSDSQGDDFFVACAECGNGTDYWPLLDDAVKKWNTRNGHFYTVDDYKQDAMERANGL
jgi:Lar family restriction alleviation protein